MPIRLGLLAYPVVVVGLMAARRSGSVGKFLKAGAISPDTARKPASLQIANREDVEIAVHSGVLIATGDGRYYVDVALYRRKQFRFFCAVAGISAIILGAFLVVHYLVT